MRSKGYSSLSAGLSAYLRNIVLKVDIIFKVLHTL